ncbi:MAG: hypothetical protein V4496_01055 [Pseudomonadota bacterium]
MLNLEVNSDNNNSEGQNDWNNWNNYDAVEHALEQRLSDRRSASESESTSSSELEQPVVTFWMRHQLLVQMGLISMQAIIQTIVIGFSDRDNGQAEGSSPALAVSLMLLPPILLSLQLNWQAASPDAKVSEKLHYLALSLSVEVILNIVGYAVLSLTADNFPKVMSSEYTNAHNPFSDEAKKLFEQLSYAFYVWPSIIGVWFLLNVAVSRTVNQDVRDWKIWCVEMFDSEAWKTWRAEMLDSKAWKAWLLKTTHGVSVPMTLAIVGSRFAIQNYVTSAAESYRPVHFAAEAGQPAYDLTPGNQVANFYMQLMNVGFGVDSCYESPDKNADMTGHGTMTCLVFGACLVLYMLSPELKKPGYDAAYLSASLFVGAWTLLMRQFANCHSTGAVITAPLVAMCIPLESL